MPMNGKPRQRAVTPELIRGALLSVPPDVERDTWVRIGMAIKAELGSSAGFELWSEWSSTGATYKARDARDTWRSLKAGGRTTIGTLFGIAKDHGWRFPDEDATSQTPADAAAVQRQAAELATRKRREREAEAEQYRQRADRAARDAGELWADASEAGQSPYLQRKGVQGHGVRYLADGTLLVPMRNAAGELQNVQRIAPAKPANGAPEKRFLPGGRKSGLWHLIGSLEGAAVLLLAEGYATAASLHEATGRPVGVAFDAGNLVHVAKMVRELHPTLPLLVCGDDDRETEQRTGKNPGRLKAAAAARAAKTSQASAATVFPDGLPGGGTDFNDLAAHAGLDAVRDLVERAAGLSSDADARQAVESSPQTRGDDGQEPGQPDKWGFLCDARGVWHVGRDKDGERRKPQWLCAPLAVTARTRSDDANGWGFLLEWSDLDGNPKSWAMPSALLSGEGAEWAARLRDMGLEMAVGPGVRNMVGTYINTRHPEERVTCVDKVGWHGGVYVLPNGSIGECPGKRYVFQTEAGADDLFRQRGTLEDWQAEVAALCPGNSRLTFAVSFALAGPVLPFSGLEGAGVHLRGDSRGGKTTALRAAASVFGRPSYVQQWRTTANALENTAVQANHALLVLDELGQLDPAEAGTAAYLLSNGMDKGRSTRGLIPRRRRTWHLLFLSSGEVSLADLAADAGKRMRTGQEVRMADLPVDAGAGMGGLETLHGFESPAELAEALKDNAARFYGTAGRAWLQWCADHYAELPARLLVLLGKYRDEFVPEASSGQVRTVGSRFALAAAAGELATEAGITGWQAGEAAQGCRTCFEAWLAARGHLDNGEEAGALCQVRAWIEKNGDALLTWTHRVVDDHRASTPMRAGFKRLVDDNHKPLTIDAATDYLDRRSSTVSSARAEAQTEYLILPEAFKRDLCKGFDPEMVARVLKRNGHLQHEADRLTRPERIPGLGRIRVYRINPSILSADR